MTGPRRPYGRYVDPSVERCKRVRVEAEAWATAAVRAAEEAHRSAVDAVRWARRARWWSVAAVVMAGTDLVWLVASWWR